MDKPLVIILENNRDNAALFRHVMELAGFRTEIISDGQVAVERLSKCRPDILIIDLDLTGFSGNRILDLVRKDEGLRHCKVIAVTSQSMTPNSLAVEPDLLLFTPISIEQFSDFIERFQLKIKYQTTVPMIGEPWDRVTGVYNQLFFKNRLISTLIQSKEIEQYLFALITVNIDQNKSVQNQLDMRDWIIALRETAEALKASVRPTDTIARFDLDNFIIMVDNIPNKDIPIMVASTIHKKLQEKLTNLKKDVQFPIRIGILLCDPGYEKVDEILQDAKTARSPRKSQTGVFEYYDRASLRS